VTFGEHPRCEPELLIRCFGEISDEELESFDNINVVEVNIFPELGSRSFLRGAIYCLNGNVSPINTWQVVQKGVFRFVVFFSDGWGRVLTVKMVFKEFLFVEASFSSDC